MRNSSKINPYGREWPQALFKCPILLNNNYIAGFAIDLVTVRFFKEWMQVSVFNEIGNCNTITRKNPNSKQELLEILFKVAGKEFILKQMHINEQ